MRDGLRQAGAAARAAGVRLGFEPVHPGQDDTAGFVTSLGDALALLDEAGVDDVGIMADTYNLAHEESADVVAAAARLTGLHVADELPEPVPGVRTLPAADGALGRADPRPFAMRAGTGRSTSRSSRRPRRSGRCRRTKPRARRTRAPRRCSALADAVELDALSDFGDPAGGEVRLHAVVDRARADDDA